ncbi:reverse transcriptase domain-containing protein [Faecalibaculum rodentium]|uniref:reverse transcriptase domain-containing protein n=1 Tax=Faecalibaculum rodentium TaxID=1702221 RepID=UPI00262BF657|nr:reverse transcriptase domain-containing protein [Faecalibaculum rodentium]
MNESEVLGLIRKFLKAGVMENGVKQKTEEGTPQGGPLSPLLANIYLDKFDKELEQRGLRFVRYADDCIIFTKSEKAAHRVIASVISWLKRKLFLTASAEKTRVVRPTKGKFLGFTFWKGSDGWKCRPHDDSKKRLKEKIRSVTVRRKAAAIPLAVTFTRINQIMRGWINYYRIGAMSMWLKETFGPWMRHQVRVMILKQWKHRGTIFTNLWKLNGRISHPFPKSYVFAQSMTHCGWYRLGNNEVVNMILNPHILSLKRKDRPGLVDPWKYYSCA